MLFMNWLHLNLLFGIDLNSSHQSNLYQFDLNQSVKFFQNPQAVLKLKLCLFLNLLLTQSVVFPNHGFKS